MAGVTVHPLAGALGAEIRGADLAKPLDEATRSAIFEAFREYLVVYFPDQDLTPEQHLAFGQMFGPHQPIPHIFSVDGYPELQIVSREASETDTYVVGGNWHTDSTYLEKPPTAVAMRAVNVPDVGGDTLFSNMYLAYQGLSPKLREVLDGLNAVHSASRVFGSDSLKRDKSYTMPKMDTDYGDQESVHPVAPAHPVTGRRHLFVNKVYTRRFEGMTAEESRPLLEFLYEHIAKPEFTCRVRWRNNQMLVWDNRATMHRAVPDYPGKDRYLERTTMGLA